MNSYHVECIFSESGGMAIINLECKTEISTKMLSLIKGHTIIRSSDWTEDGFTFPANESERCAEPYCHSKVIEYNASKDQISGSEIHGPELVT